MDEMAEEKDFWDELREKMEKYSDEELTEVLKKRKQYEKQAVYIAVEEAVKRGLIHSEQDLFSESFTDEPSRFSLFPCPDKLHIRMRTIRSIARTLLVVAAIPLVFGVLKFQVHRYVEGIAMVVAGLSWITASWMIYRKQEKKYWPVLLLTAVLAGIYIARMLFLLKGLATMDYFIASALFLVLFYVLLYLRKLLAGLPEN